MTAEVVAWPPFALTGWALHDDYQQSRSVGVINGQPRTSSWQRARRKATAIIAGRGTDQAGAGFVRMLNRRWEGKPRLTRVACLSSLWYLSARDLNLRNSILEWTSGATNLVWTSGVTDVIWGNGHYALSGTPATDGSWVALQVAGLPPNQIVARPSDTITVMDGVTSETRLALTVARSDGSGNALIRVESAFTLTGLVSIGDPEIIVFEAVDVPQSVQTLSGDFLFEWNFREAFADEYDGGFVEADPWR